MLESLISSSSVSSLARYSYSKAKAKSGILPAGCAVWKLRRCQCVVFAASGRVVYILEHGEAILGIALVPKADRAPIAAIWRKRSKPRTRRGSTHALMRRDTSASLDAGSRALAVGVPAASVRAHYRSG